MNERIAKMEQKVDNIEQGINRIETALNEHIRWEDGKYQGFATKLESEVKNSDKKYSGKWVEKVVVGLVIAAVTSLIYSLK